LPAQIREDDNRGRQHGLILRLQIFKNVLGELPIIRRDATDAEQKKIRKDIIAGASRTMELALDMDNILNGVAKQKAA